MKNWNLRGHCVPLAAALLFAAPGPRPAEAQEARFANADRSIEIVGTVRSFDGETYVIESLFGVLDISSDAVTCEGDGCPIRQVTTLWTEGEVGSQVSLTSADGTMSLSGELVMFDGHNIRIRNSIGLLDLPFDEMRCTGSGCPEATEEVTYIIPES